MKKIFISLVVLVTLGVLYAQSDHILSFFVSQRLVMNEDVSTADQSSEIYFETDNSSIGEDTYIYSTGSGDLSIVTDVLRVGDGFWADAPSPATNDMSQAFFWSEDFIGTNLDSSGGIETLTGWKVTGDATYDLLQAAGTLGGWLNFNAETGSNNEVYAQLGELGTETFVEATASSGKKWWLEFNLTPSSVTNAASFLVGLAEEGSSAGDFINDSGADIADKDVIGFVVWEGDPNALLAIYQTSGGAFVSAFSTAITATNMTLGISFDGASTITWYVNGTSIGTKATTVTAMPDTEELSPIIAVKQGAGDGGITLDWIKLVAER